MSESMAPGSGSLVAIASVPYQFHTSKYHYLEHLFVPLLSSAQQACDLMGARIRGEQAAAQAAAFMAGELLRDASFVAGRRETSAATLYTLDFVADQFLSRASVVDSGRSRTSLFRVLVEGKIRGDKFRVSDPVTNTILFEFNRYEADKPDFFSREFPFIAAESRKNPLLYAGNQETLLRGVIGINLEIQLSDATYTVLVERATDEQSVNVRNPRDNAVIMNLPLAAVAHLPKLIETVKLYLVANPTVRSSLSGS